tara:strand:- start:1016 stop:1216 length:201 start_codon:yes stop_codon:yes gene_type:complete
MGGTQSTPADGQPATLSEDANEQMTKEERTARAFQQMEQIVLKQEARIYELNKINADLQMRLRKSE